MSRSAFNLATLPAQALDLQLLRLHLAVARKRLPRIGGKLLHPFAQHILMHVQITCLPAQLLPRVRGPI